MSATKISVYTDGSCKHNPGPGGWCAILVCDGNEKILSGGESETTNNRMELTAVIKALEVLKRPCEVDLISDSQYVLNGLTKGWAVSWKRNGWRKSDKTPALNPDLWDRLLELSSVHKLNCIWTRGHDGHEYNERCDSIARAEAEKYI